MKRPKLTRVPALVAVLALGEVAIFVGVAMFSLAVALIQLGVQLVAGAVLADDRKDARG